MNAYKYFPDDQSTKRIVLQAAGLKYEGGGRHVLLTWANGIDVTSTGATRYARQIIQITQDAQGYHYDDQPVVKFQSIASQNNNEYFKLGEFTRAQRDRVLTIAKQTKFRQDSKVNGCRVWMGDVLQVMLNESLITQEDFDKVFVGVPLVKRMAEEN